MKAYVLNGIGDIALRDAKRPELDGEGIVGRNGQTSVSDDDCVILRVRAAGICGSDIPRIYKTGAYHHPLIPGHEFSGKVTECGRNVSADLTGKRVGVFPLIPCMKCSRCKSGHYEMCRSYNYLGSRCDGGFAEYVKVPASSLIELPDNVTFEQAAMLEPMAVAMHAIRQCGIPLVPDDAGRSLPVAVCGMGTIGLLTVMHLKGMGYDNIICIGNKEFHREKALELGIPEDRYFDFNKDDPAERIRTVTDGEGVAYYFECVGKNAAVSMGLNVLGASGALQLVGNPASDMTFGKDEYWKILRQQLTLTGTWNSSYRHSPDDDWNLVIRALKEGRIAPEKFITHLLDLEDLGRGFEIMRDKTEDYIKVMCHM
ncbi:MAG: galactitol-1-phosphate 5-dehydrogenase [Lachnospiraceae bacterium]|nr:galactitol-1-phosphate 5-dehydrogenase [Lachnospiraceae bacterium]